MLGRRPPRAPAPVAAAAARRRAARCEPGDSARRSGRAGRVPADEHLAADAGAPSLAAPATAAAAALGRGAVTGPAVPVTQDGQDPGTLAGPAGTGIGRAAALIAVLTIAGPAARPGPDPGVRQDCGRDLPRHRLQHRQPAAEHHLRHRPRRCADQHHGAGAGQAGGAVGRPIRRRPPRSARPRRRCSPGPSLILVPVSLVIALAAGPLAGLLNPVNPTRHCARAPLVAVTGHMLAVFAPQILLYGLAVVLYGILQAHRRFAGAGPGAADLQPRRDRRLPGVRAARPGRRQQADRRCRVSAELMLAVGTTAGVAALALTALVPAWRLRRAGAADAAVPGRGRAPGGRPGRCRHCRARRAGRRAAGGHPAGERPRPERRHRALSVRLADVRGRLRRPRDLDRGQRVPGAVGSRGRASSTRRRPARCARCC